MKMVRTVKSIRDSAEDIYNDSIVLELKTSKAKKVIVLVEGAEDEGCYQKFFNADSVHIASCYGCGRVALIHEYLKKHKRMPACLAIIDSDFRKLTKVIDCNEEHFYTDFHDMEMSMVAISSLFESALNKKQILGVNYQQRTAILQELKCLSMARFFNMERKQWLSNDGMGLDLRSLETEDITNVENLVNYFKPTRTYIANGLHIKALKRFMNEHADVNLLQLTNGHDFLNRWAYHIHNKWGKVISEDDLRVALIDSFKTVIIRNTRLFKSLKKYSDKKHLNIMA